MADYISRQAAIDRFENLSYADWNQGASTTWANAFSECADMIRELPSEDAEPVRHGKWIDGKRMGYDGVFVWHRECSECGYERKDDNIDNDTLYCPNCGARMECE